MRIFITGATGFIGSAVVPELLVAGHIVTGLSQSEATTQELTAAGAGAHKGSLEDLDSLRSGAADADAVIHLAFINDFQNLAKMCDKDRVAVEALGSGLLGTPKPIFVASFSGLGNTVEGQAALESNDFDPNDQNPRIASEQAAASLAGQGVNVKIVRFPMVHDPFKQGIITAFIALARKKRLSAYVRHGDNHFPSVSVQDVGAFYRLALDKPQSGPRYHVIAEEGIRFRDIAEVVGRRLKVPVRSMPMDEAKQHFDHLLAFATKDLRASSARTKNDLGWQPDGPDLMADMNRLRF